MTHAKQLLLDLVSELLQTASEDDLASVYYALRPSHRPGSTPPPAPDTNAKPGSTVSLVERALQRAKTPVPARQVVELVHAEQPAVSPSSVTGTLSKLVREGKVVRRGEPRSGMYSLRLDGHRRSG